MAKKKTLICIHVMPGEIEMFERLISQMKKSFLYLDESDDVTLKVTLNLNPELTNWQDSEYKQGYFVSRFGILFNGLKNINEVILDTSCWGTTQQKRESIKLNYDQFIFCDTDILFHEHMLKYQLNLSYQLDGLYLVSPSLAKWWDGSWDLLCHSEYLTKEYGFGTTEEAIKNTYKQTIKEINVRQISDIKFGCGMHTLYSKSFWELVGIPESFGGYGPEDTFGMTAANYAIQLGYDIKQYVLDGIYITEDYLNRKSYISEKIKIIDRKTEFYEKAKLIFDIEGRNFLNRLIQNSQSNL